MARLFGKEFDAGFKGAREQVVRLILRHDYNDTRADAPSIRRATWEAYSHQPFHLLTDMPEWPKGLNTHIGDVAHILYLQNAYTMASSRIQPTQGQYFVGNEKEIPVVRPYM